MKKKKGLLLNSIASIALFFASMGAGTLYIINLSFLLLTIRGKDENYGLGKGINKIRSVLIIC
ncbi:hypothetical protein [Paramaledivibacter caminithermalis]|jgi:hypothetical protein|uniref:Uncharacterized protein n=1 Tax=Paramaledivibacter caminithermalis (strain DSM 15212 / CIP 107654 / DViRD3) TaxID=1121301 RepID=A0A1M6NDV5_PARC5|nr:hypothetical protein [Paramaledivibacter caminithermalis]SHJ93901.1 hypothetical protein SAMN02745912_01700 [Paramaledivibacter caminithermalis DSM 15212]